MCRASCCAARVGNDTIQCQRLLTTYRYRAACEALISTNFEYALAHELQTSLWNAHLKVNATFRQEHKLVWIIIGYAGLGRH